MPSASDRNLMVGLLAFQLDLVGKDELVQAMGTWATEKSKTLEDVFLAMGAIDQQTHQLLASLVRKRLEVSDQDSSRLLRSSADVDSLRDELSRLEDADIDQSLGSILPGKYSSTQAAAHEKTAGADEPAIWETLDSNVGAAAEVQRFRVLRPHAKGGLGEVSIAMDAELNRQVALKQMQSRYADDTEAQQRFIVEAEVTGGLEHPGVVPVYGLGRYADGRPYYAMRFIRGESFKEASDRYHQKFGTTHHTSDKTLELRRLLNALRDVCQTIEYAHRSGVLHRDLKPDNIMLGPFGETLVVDWGLAKTEAAETPISSGGGQSSSQGSRSSVTPTVMGSVVGTPAFMSPEQAQGKVDEISPASDVYSLGATLYYLICGRSPFASDPEMGKSSAEVGKVLQRVARGEFVRPRDVEPSIPKPLAAICLKAMALEPSQRYPTSEGLGEDIERFLADEPIAALSDSIWVRLRRWARNHQTATITAASLILASTVGLSIFSSLLTAKQNELERSNQELIVAERRAKKSAEVAEERSIEAERERQLAETARERAERAGAEAELARVAEQDAKADALAFGSFLVNDILAAARPKDVNGGLGIDVTVVDAIKSAQENLDQVFEGRPRAEAIARNGIGDTWYALGEYQRAYNQLSQAEKLFTGLSGSDHIDALTARSASALALAHLGQLEEALQIQRDIADKLENLLGPVAPQTLTARSNLALSLIEAGDYERAISLLKEVYESSRDHHGERDPATLRSLNNYADALRYASEDRQPEAIALLEKLLISSREVVGSTHPDTLKVTNNLATLYEQAGDSDKAIAMLERTLDRMADELGADHPTTLVIKTNLAFALVQAGLFDRAIELLTEVVEQSSRKLSAEHPSTLNAIDILASTYDAAGKLEQAIELYRKALEGRQRTLGVSHADTLTTQNNLALAYLNVGDTANAVPLFETVLETRRSLLQPRHDDLQLSINNLAAAYIAAGQPNRALPLYQELFETLDATVDPQTRWRVCSNLADAYVRTNQASAAIQVWEPLLQEMERELETERADLDPVQVGLETVRQGLAIAKLRTGAIEEATDLFRTAIERQRERYAQSQAEGDLSMIRGLLIYLAICQNETGNFGSAEQSARESAEIARQLMPDDWRRFNAESIWGEALLAQGKLQEAQELIESAHAGLMDRQRNLPPELQAEFIVPSFDRMIEMHRANGNTAKASQFAEKKTELLKVLGESD